MLVVESAGITDVGRKRTGNEDALHLDDEHRFYVVADGMGGHQAGEVASSLVVETMRDYIKRFGQAADVEALADADETLSKEANRLLSSIQLANHGVHQVSHTQEAYRGMGSTVSAVYLTDETVIAANVGDSPIYLIHNNSIERISVLHTVAAEQAALNPQGGGQVGSEFRHMLTRAMGVHETVAPDICEIPLFRGDVIVISSDGLSDKVSPEEIRDIVGNEKPDKACRALVDLANARGGDDNITVIVLKMKKTGNSGVKDMISALKDKLFTLF